MRVLVVNAGSSSLKLRLLEDHDVLERSADLVVGRAGIDSAALGHAIAPWPIPGVVGHRIVHGGSRFTSPALVNATVREQLEDVVELAPLHQPGSLAALDEVTALLPSVPAIACFDTAFHATMGPAATTYAVPREWREKYGIRRYGFHGLSHAYSSRRAAEIVGRPPAGLRVVTCHLGAGASLAAVVDGRCVDTTMGFTPLEGLVMATRSGNVDPGLLLWLEEHEHLTPREVAAALEEHSGLLALAGTADMREVEAAVARHEPDAMLALDVYTHHLVAGIAAMTAAAGGIDVLTFSGGVGEHSAEVRRRAANGLRFLGVELDGARNVATRSDADITAHDALVRTLVVAAREDVQIAGEVRRLLVGSPRPSPATTRD